MRELKFRAWDGAQMLTEENFNFVVSDCDSIIRLDEYGWTEHGVDCVEQYTGLKDKNGKEIYEGDILRWEHYYGMTGECKEYTERVYWEEKDAGYVVGDWFEPLGSLVYEDAVEVVGNIHENADLIEGGEYAFKE